MAVGPNQQSCSILPQGGRRSVVILASGEAADFADALRRDHDNEWFQRVPPHISLLGPFEPAESDEKLTSILTRAVEGAQPFDVRLGAADAFIVPELFLFMAIEDEAPLHLLHGRILKKLPAYKPPREYHPHLTLGRFASEKALSPVMAKVREEYGKRCRASQPFVFDVEEIHLYGEDPETGVYRSVSQIALPGDFS